MAMILIVTVTYFVVFLGEHKKEELEVRFIRYIKGSFANGMVIKLWHSNIRLGFL